MSPQRACLPFVAAVVLAAPLAAAPATAITEQKLEVTEPVRLSGFGFSVALHKTLAVVGAPYAYSAPDVPRGGEIWSGAAYVFRKRGGAWTEVARLFPSDAEQYDFAAFGRSVATDGATVVVGAPSLANGAGAAYVFEEVNGEWAEVAKLTGKTEEGDVFGWAVAVESDTIAVGAPWADDVGDVYLFTRGTGVAVSDGWKAAGTLKQKGGKSGDSAYLSFGRSIDISGDRLAVGAPGHDPDGMHSDAGAVFVFARKGEEWRQEAMLSASDELRWLYFGEDVAIDRRTLVIGSRGDWDEAGAAYVYERKPGGWEEQVKLIAQQALPGDWAGADAVDLHGRRIVIGARFDGESAGRAGAMYLFQKMGRNWVEKERLLPPDGRADHLFGGAVAVFKRSLLAGASGGDTGGHAGVGAAYAYQ